MSEHLALLYADGSINALSPGTTLEQAKKDRAFSDDGERDPARLTKIARVEVEIIEIIAEPAAKPAATCQHCGKPLLGVGA